MLSKLMPTDFMPIQPQKNFPARQNQSVGKNVAELKSKNLDKNKSFSEELSQKKMSPDKSQSKNSVKPTDSKNYSNNNEVEDVASKESSVVAKGESKKEESTGEVRAKKNEISQPEKKIIEEKLLEEKIRPSSLELSPLTQRVAMNTFIHKMKEELNVEPEQLIQAFSKMSTEDLLKPPEESVGAFVEELNLDLEQEAVAKRLFEQMLNQTASSAMADYLKESGNDLSLEVLSKSELRKQRLSQDIDNMNKSFFGDKGSLQTQENVTEGNDLSNLQLKTNEQQNKSNQNNSFFNFAGTKTLKGDKAAELSLTPLSDLSAGDVATTTGAIKLSDGMLKNEQMQSDLKNLNNSLNKLESSFKDLNQNLNQEVINNDSTEMLPNDELTKTSVGKYVSDANSMNTTESVINNSSSVKTNGSNIAAAVSGFNNENKNESEQNQDSMGDNSEYYSQENLPKNNINKGSSDFVVKSGLDVQSGEESTNIKEVVDNARLMIKKGGGEMTVKMTPEGLGEVHMKVQVKNGLVNVEMVTDSNDAKKVIEKGLGELKATLASHKLDVDQIKVDISNNLATDLNDKNEENARHFAQQFMGEFKRENQAWRNNFVSLPGVRAYGSQLEDQSGSDALNVLAKNHKSKAARRLDLVA